MHFHLRQWLFARAMAKSNRQHESAVSPYRRQLLADLQGSIIEIGPGSGANLPYYRRGINWIGFEPNPYMHPWLRSKASQLGFAVDLRLSTADPMDAPDACADAVVCTLVLCSVRNQSAVLREIMRVLKPGGRFVFIEHVAAPAGSNLRQAQNFVQPIWSYMGDGCHPNRETWSALEQAGFVHLEYERFNVPVPIAVPHIAGSAIKPTT